MYVMHKNWYIKFELEDFDMRDRFNSEVCHLTAKRKSEKMLCPEGVKESHFFNL